MSIESDSAQSKDSQRHRQGWLANCGIIIPTLSVRERSEALEDANRPVMTIVDSSNMRKRVSNRRSFKKKSLSTDEKMPELIDLEAKRSTASARFASNLTNFDGIKAYSNAHAQLLQREVEEAWDREAKPVEKSILAEDRVEELAAKIILSIREYEREFIFGNLASEAIPGAETRDMGGQFLTNKERIDGESKLYEIAKMVPKGGLLHLHFNAELDPERLLEQARDMKTMYIRSIRPLLTQKDLDLTEVVFSVLDPDMVETNVNLFSPNYPGNASNFKLEEWKWKVWMRWTDFQTEFEKLFPNKCVQNKYPNILESPTCCAEPGFLSLNPAENWLKSKLVLSQEEAYGYMQTVNGVWARFNQATRCFKGLLNYEEIYKWYISKAIDRMIDENVMYAELRPMFLDPYIPSADGKRQIDLRTQMQMIVDGVKAKQVELEKIGQLDKFPFGVKVIFCSPRSIPKPFMQKQMQQCIDLKLQFPDLICGFDLVGAEDRPNHIGFYKEEFVAFNETCKELGIEIPFLFHAGETLLDTGGSTDPKNSNLYDAVVLKSKRIGHGFALMKHPHLVEKFRKTKTSPGICIELCPISNELLHLCRNIKEHPYPELLAAGIPCTVNSDNPSLFSNSMSHEFYQIMVGSPTMSLYSWKQLARWSIDYSCLLPDQQAIGREYLEQSWRRFCQQVVDTYGFLMKDDKIDQEKARAAYPKRSLAA